MLKTLEVDEVTWHFFASSSNGKIGPNEELLALLEEAGIKVMVHWPTVARGAG